MFLRSLLDLRFTGRIIEHERVIDPVSSPVGVAHSDPVTQGGLNKPLEVIPPVIEPAAVCSDAQQSAAVRIDAVPLEALGWLKQTRINDLSSAEREERALILLRTKPEWFKQSDAELGPLFWCHPSTVSRWRKSWEADGLVITKRVKRRVWMKYNETKTEQNEI